VPTRNGGITAGAAVVLLVAGMMLGYQELTVFGFAALFALLTAGLWMLARPRLLVRREIRPLRVTAGDEAVAVLIVTNEMGRRSPPITASESINERDVGVLVPSLAAHESYETSYPLPTQRRGVYAVGPLTIGHTDPLRLMEIAKSYSTTSTLIVHPGTDQVHPLPTGRSNELDGPISSLAPQGGIAFHSLREYVHGDDWRLVHWKSSARTGQLMIRHNVVPNEPRLMVLLDTSADAYENDETFEHAVSAAASLCVAALRSQFPIDLRTTAGEFLSAEEDGPGRTAALDLLAAVRRNSGDPGLTALPGLVPDDGIAALGVLTGRGSPELLGVLPQVRPRFLTVSLVRFTRTFEAAAPLPGVISLSARSTAEFVTAWNDLVPA
jgi:uncharacterized protein (DUF58 family)